MGTPEQPTPDEALVARIVQGLKDGSLRSDEAQQQAQEALLNRTPKPPVAETPHAVNEQELPAVPSVSPPDVIPIKQTNE